jgi:hypothetical protein
VPGIHRSSKIDAYATKGSIGETKEYLQKISLLPDLPAQAIYISKLQRKYNCSGLFENASHNIS